jgi:hypothetical protein
MDFVVLKCCASMANDTLRLLLIDAHPRRLLTLKMTPSFIRAHGTGLRA